MPAKKVKVQEKRKPHHDLKQVQKACSDPDTLPHTVTAALSAFALGFDKASMVGVIQGIKRSHFYKSMTSFSEHTRWQDVYHAPAIIPQSGEEHTLYVKFTDNALTEFTLLSFKLK